MNMNQRVESALNDQINAELYSSYLYLSMSAYCEAEGLSGFANWMRVQAEEELFHSTKMFDYVNERGGRVILKAIEMPQTEWKSIVEVLEDVFEHEQKVTSLINNLVTISREEKEYATENFLQWYVAEQVEEEDSVGQLLNEVKLVDGKGSGLFMLNREAGQRVFTPPTKE
jgi:ferritin